MDAVSRGSELHTFMTSRVLFRELRAAADASRGDSNKDSAQQPKTGQGGKDDEDDSDDDGAGGEYS